jgi:hypothetical protein
MGARYADLDPVLERKGRIRMSGEIISYATTGLASKPGLGQG